MPYDVLEKELKALPESYFPTMMDFIMLLKNHEGSRQSESTPQKRKTGIGKDPNFYMAPDFDETPECFRGYGAATKISWKLQLHPIK